MKKLTLIAILFLYSGFANAQNNLKKCYVPEIGFTFYVPGGYKVFVPKPEGTYLDDNGKIIKDKKTIEGLTKDDPKDILQIETPDFDKQPIFQLKFTLIKNTEMAKHTIGDSVFYKKFAIATASQSGAKFDTLFTTAKINGHKFRKTIITSYIREINASICSYVGLFNNYYLTIGFTCADKKIAENMISLIEAGTFDQ